VCTVVPVSANCLGISRGFATFLILNKINKHGLVTVKRRSQDPPVDMAAKLNDKLVNDDDDDDDEIVVWGMILRRGEFSAAGNILSDWKSR